MKESSEERDEAMREVLQMLSEIGWVQRSRFDGKDILVEWSEDVQGALKPLDRFFSDVLIRLTPLQLSCVGFLIEYCLRNPPESKDT